MFTDVQIKVVNHIHINLAKEQNLLIGKPFACKHPDPKKQILVLITLPFAKYFLL